jgi:hypothetical protein
MAYMDRFDGMGKSLMKVLLAVLVVGVPIAGYHLLRLTCPLFPSNMVAEPDVARYCRFAFI